MGLVTHHAHAARAGAAKMPPTPRQTESLEPRILGGGGPRIWRMLPGKRTLRQLAAGRLLRSTVKRPALPRGSIDLSFLKDPDQNYALCGP
jgi:hypothetical protein